MTTVLLDTHVLYWWSSSSARLSRPAARAVDAATELAVSAMTWFELAWLAQHERIRPAMPVRSWLDELSQQVRTVGISPAVAITAASLPASFTGDPIDRIIYSTALEHGWSLVTRDERMREHRHPRKVTIW